jgi:hypothetical protein
MPRQRVNTKTAERAGTPGPKRRGRPPATGAEMALRRRLVREAMLVSATPDATVAMVHQKFPELDEAAILRLYEEAEAELIGRSTEKLSTKKAKQEARILGHITAARGKGAFGAVASLEREYSNVAGTSAPVRVHHDVSFTDRQNEAWKRTLFAAGKGTLERLLKGKTVSLGLAQGQAIPATGEEVK